MQRAPSSSLPFRRRFAGTISLLLAVAAACLLACLSHPAEAHAETTGTISPSIKIFYGTGETVSGEWQEDTLTIDGKPAYCVEVDSSFESGLEVTSCDPVASGIWSQQICTKLALIDQFVKSGNFVSTRKGTGDGHRVSDASEQYAVAQCYIWKFLNDSGYSKNHYGWFGAATLSGTDLTGSDTDDQIWDYVKENIDIYQGSAKYYDCGNSQDLACSFSLSPTKGYVELTKKSANEELSSSNDFYSLAGAEYGVYSDENCQSESLVAELSTDDEGKAKSKALPAGNYFVKETKASAGFRIDEACYPVQVEPGAETLVNAEAGCVYEQPCSGSITLQKKSSRPGISEGNGSYSLEGALYGIYSDEACKDLVAKAETDENGFLQVDGLPVGTCYVREISPPAGFSVNTAVYRAVVEDGKVTPVNGEFVEDLPKCTIPSILLEKYDSAFDPGSGGSQGEGSLENAEFEVRFYAGQFANAKEAEESGKPQRTWVFKTDKDGKIPFDEDHLVSGDALFQSSENKPCIPLGTLVIKESAPPKGNLASDEVHCVQISDDGSSGEIVESFQAVSAGDKIKRGDLRFTKISGSQEHTLAGIPFAITCKATGETHVVVTDENGLASTSSKAVRHSIDTNGNDDLMEASGSEDGEKEEDRKDEDSESETGEPKEDVPPVTDPPVDDDDSSDTNDASENPEENGEEPDSDSEANPEDAEPVTKPPVDDDDSNDTNDTNADLELEAMGSEENESEENGESETERADQPKDGRSPKPTGIWFGLAQDGKASAPLNDEEGALPYGTYLIEELPCDGNEGLQLTSASVVISEDSQTVDLGFVDDPKATIGTHAVDGSDNDKTVAASDTARIVDTVSYSNLIPGKTYELTGKLMDASSNEPAKTAEGKEVTGKAEFTPEEAQGTAQVSFDFQTDGIEGSKLVAFETLSCEGRVLALHESIEDEDQSVSIAGPSIGTQASSSDGRGQVASANGRIAITDTVSYTALVPGKEYNISGTLVNAATSEPLLIGEEQVSASCSFTPENSSGSVDIVFEFDANGVEDVKKIAVFEKLYAQDSLIAAHEDPNDPGQTVDLVEPGIQTNLSDKETGEKTASARKSLQLIDQVHYSNLTPGAEYELEGRLVSQATGEAVEDAEGKPITATCTFAPEEAQGTAPIEFSLDGSSLDGSSLVAFETLSRDGTTVAEHADLDSQTQIVAIESPAVQTYANDEADQDQIVPSGSEAKIRDTVSITNAIPGRTYTVAGILMDKSTGLPLLQKGTSDQEEEEGTETTKAAAESEATDKQLEEFWSSILDAAGCNRENNEDPDGTEQIDLDAIKKLIAENPQISSRIAIEQKDVTPESPSFEVDMEFALSTEGIAGQTVVFEALIDKESSAIVATHSDLQDQAQTIEIEAAEKSYPPSESKAVNGSLGSSYDKTGNMLAKYAWIPATVAAIGCTAGALARYRSRKLKRRKGIRC